MVYQQKFVANIKCNGKVLRERDGSVFLPFGSEYSIHMKNLESRKALVKIWIDGENITSEGLIVYPNSDFSLDGILEDDGSIRNKFKFIKKTEKIQNHRGDKIDDGLIRIEFQFEKHVPISIPVEHHHYPYRPYYPIWYTNHTVTCGSNTNITYTTNYDNTVYSQPQNTNTCHCSDNFNLPSQDEGITVRGSEINQNYCVGYIGDLEENSFTIVIALKGISGNTTIEAPLTVQTKIKCPSCGTKVKSYHKCCFECGTHIKL